MHIQYISVFVNNMETGVDFFKNKLGFEVVNFRSLNVLVAVELTIQSLMEMLELEQLCLEV